jgi:hypothetical protein
MQNNVNMQAPKKKASKAVINNEVLTHFVAHLVSIHDMKLNGWLGHVLNGQVAEHKIYEFAVKQAIDYCHNEVSTY